ncbi:hypothetical protein Q8F55_001316 [Vanrija albida]|uniref:Uncharacterized protein n=1 Tax=Vanrija albida TaxID=181172 RepID=A0ABR3QGE6_9TREE
MPHSQTSLQGAFMQQQQPQQQQQLLSPDQHHLQQQAGPSGLVFNPQMVNHANPAGHYVLPQDGANMFMSYNMPQGR